MSPKIRGQSKKLPGHMPGKIDAWLRHCTTARPRFIIEALLQEMLRLGYGLLFNSCGFANLTIGETKNIQESWSCLCHCWFVCVFLLTHISLKRPDAARPKLPEHA